MVALLSGQLYLFKQPFLKGLWPDFNGAEEYLWAVVFVALSALVKLLSVVRYKVATVPVAFKDGVYFVNHVWVAGARESGVPFQTDYLG